MSKPRKNKKTTASQQCEPEVTDVGVPGLFPAGQWDIDEEMENNEALREHRRDTATIDGCPVFI